MGYYTRHDLSKNSEEIIQALREQSGYEYLDDDIKWYNCREDMKAVSVKFPSDILHVKGEGEESGDIWQAWYVNGKECYQRAEIMLPSTPTEFI